MDRVEECEPALSQSRVDASVSGGERETPAADEDHASAGAKSARTALPHPWKATVKLSLSSSMQLDIATTVRRTGLRTAPFATRRAWLGGPGGRLVNVRWFEDPDGNTLSII